MLSSFASNAIIGLLALEAVNGAVVTQISDGQIQNSPISVKVSGSAAATTSSSSQTSTSICPAPTNSAGLLTDINIINKYWGQVSPYFDNTEDHFGVEYVGLPDGCQIVSINPVADRTWLTTARSRHILYNAMQTDSPFPNSQMGRFR